MPPRTLMRTLSLAILLPLLAACASTRSDQAALARTALVGLPKSDLLSCAGAPAFMLRLVRYSKPAITCLGPDTCCRRFV